MAVTSSAIDDLKTPAPDYLRRAREIAPLIAAEADEIERRRRLTEPVFDALVANGLYRLLQPRSLGGAELPPPLFIEVIEEIAKADASTAWCLCQGSGCSMSAAYLDAEVAHEVFGPPTGVLAWGPPKRAEARVVDGGYRVSGIWNFASGGRHASWLGAHSYVVQGDGTPLRRPDGRQVQRTLLFPAAKAEMTDVWNTMGLRGTASDSYAVEGLFVADRYTFDRDIDPVRRERGPLYVFSTGMMYAQGFAGVALGLARAMLDAVIAVAHEKTPYNAKRTMRENHVIQAEVGRCEARLRAARAYLLAASEAAWRDVQKTPVVTMEHRIDLRLAATGAIHDAAAVAEIVYHAAGATAIFATQPFERRFRDVHTVSQQVQGRQAHFETAGQVLLGLEPELPLFSI